jgi:hypothetical protein
MSTLSTKRYKTERVFTLFTGMFSFHHARHSPLLTDSVIPDDENDKDNSNANGKHG